MGGCKWQLHFHPGNLEASAGGCTATNYHPITIPSALDTSSIHLSTIWQDNDATYQNLLWAAEVLQWGRERTPTCLKYLFCGESTIVMHCIRTTKGKTSSTSSYMRYVFYSSKLLKMFVQITNVYLKKKDLSKFVNVIVQSLNKSDLQKNVQIVVTIIKCNCPKCILPCNTMCNATCRATRSGIVFPECEACRKSQDQRGCTILYSVQAVYNHFLIINH